MSLGWVLWTPSRERNFSMQRRRVQIRLFLLQRLTRRRVRTRKSPLFAGQMHGSPVEFDTWRLAGGGSRAQTGDPPPSHRTGLRREPGTEICDAGTGTQKPAYQLAEINPQTRSPIP